MGHGKERPTREIKRDFRVGQPSSLQARGTTEENDGEEERQERGEMNQKRPKPEPEVDSSMMRLRRFEKRETNPTQVNEREGGGRIPVRETLREKGQRRTRER